MIGLGERAFTLTLNVLLCAWLVSTRNNSQKRQLSKDQKDIRTRRSYGRILSKSKRTLTTMKVRSIDEPRVLFLLSRRKTLPRYTTTCTLGKNFSLPRSFFLSFLSLIPKTRGRFSELSILCLELFIISRLHP